MNPTIRRIPVSTLDIPELQPYRTLRRPVEHMKAGIFVAEGEKVVRRLLESRLSVVSLLMTDEWCAVLFPNDRAIGTTARMGETLPVYVADKKLLESIVGYNLHQGIMAIGRIQAATPPDTLFRKLPQPFLLVALDGLVNAENVGLVIRNCAAFGVDAVLVGETSSSPFLRRAVRNSMGTVFSVPIVSTENLAASLSRLQREYAASIVAAHPHGEHTIYQCGLAGNVCIVLGNEGGGISAEVLDVCTELVAVPMMYGTDSLNVASASAVFLFEARRQREPQK